MPSSLVQRIRIRQNAFWFEIGRLLPLGVVLTGYRCRGQTGPLSHVSRFIQTRQGRANLAPAVDFHLQAPAIVALTARWAPAAVSQASAARAACEGCAGARPLRLRRFNLWRFRLRSRQSRRNGLNRRDRRHNFRCCLRLPVSRSRNRQPLVEILGLEPRLGTQALYEIVVPQPGRFDIEGRPPAAGRSIASRGR